MNNKTLINELSRINELMGNKSILNEQPRARLAQSGIEALESLFKMGDESLKIGDNLTDGGRVAREVIDTGDQFLIKQQDEIFDALKKWEGNQAGPKETAILNKAVLAVEKLTEVEIAKIRQSAITDYLTKDPTMQTVSSTMDNAVDQIIVSKYENNDPITLEELETIYRDSGFNLAKSNGKSDEVANEIADAWLNKWRRSERYKKLFRDGEDIATIAKRVDPNTQLVTSKKSTDFVTSSGSAKLEDASLEATKKSELTQVTSLSNTSSSILRKLANKTDFTKKLVEDFILENQRTVVEFLEKYKKNPEKFLDTSTGKYYLDYYRQYFKTHMEGMISKDPSWRFFNPLSDDGATLLNYEKAWQEVESTIRLEAKNQGIPDADVEKLITELKTGPGMYPLDNFLKNAEKDLPGVAEVGEKPGFWRGTIGDFFRDIFKLPKIGEATKNAEKATTKWFGENAGGFEVAFTKSLYIIGEILSWVGRGRLTAFLTYGVFRGPMLLMRNMMRYGGNAQDVVLSMFKTWLQLVTLKLIVTPLISLLTGMFLWIAEALNYDVKAPEGKKLWDDFMDDIKDIYTGEVFTLASTYVPFQEGPLVRAIDEAWQYAKETGGEINQQRIEKEVDALETKYNTESQKLLDEDQDKYMKKIGTVDKEFRYFRKGIQRDYKVNNITKEQADLLHSKLTIRAIPVEGTYEKITNLPSFQDLVKKWKDDESITDDQFKEETQKLFPERDFEKRGNIGGLEYGLLANNGKIYRVGSAASPGTDFYLPGHPIDTYVFIDDDGKPKLIKEFLPKITTVTENYMKNLIRKIILEEEEEKTLKMKDWNEIFTFQKVDEKESGKYTDVKIKMDSVMDRMPHWRKKYKKQCEDLENCDDDGEDDSFVRAVIDTHPEVVRVLFTKGMAHLTSSDEQEDLNESLHGLLAFLRESKNVEVEVWSVYRHPSSPDKIWSLVKGDYKPKELSSMDKKMQQSPGNSVEKKKDSLSELKKKESEAIRLLSTDEKKGLMELPIKVRNRVKEMIKKGWTTERPSDNLMSYYKEDEVDSVFEDPIKVYKLRPNQTFFNFIKSQKSDDEIKRGFCRSIYYIEKEFDLPKEVSSKIDDILNKCENKLEGKYGQNYL
jgi:hypothetical protein